MDPQTPRHVVQRFNAEVIQDGNRVSFEQLMAPGFVNRSAPPGAPDNAEGDKVTTRKTIAKVHSGELMGIAPTGRSVTIDVIDIVRVENGRYAEH